MQILTSAVPLCAGTSRFFFFFFIKRARDYSRPGNTAVKKSYKKPAGLEFTVYCGVTDRQHVYITWIWTLPSLSSYYPISSP